MSSAFKIAVFTSTRAGFGIMSALLRLIENDSRFQLHIFATGTHFSHGFGSTVTEINELGFQHVHSFPILHSVEDKNHSSDIASQVLMGMSDFLVKSETQLLIILGDRFEALSAAFSAQLNRVPIAHIHGGEITQGAMDDAFRHAISKMATLHFPATETYRQRLLQLGESEERVYNIGSLSLEQIKHLELMDKTELEDSLNWKFQDKNILVTLHPETLAGKAQKQLAHEFFKAINELKNIGVIITYPNADDGHEAILAEIKNIEGTNDANVCIIPSLGLKRYFSCLSIVDLVAGNSSSGIIEAASFQVKTVNVGDRQKGRERAKSVFDVAINCEGIVQLINTLFLKKQNSKELYQNPYEKGGVSGASMFVKAIHEFLSKPQQFQKPFIDRVTK